MNSLQSPEFKESIKKILSYYESKFTYYSEIEINTTDTRILADVYYIRSRLYSYLDFENEVDMYLDKATECFEKLKEETTFGSYKPEEIDFFLTKIELLRSSKERNMESFLQNFNEKLRSSSNKKDAILLVRVCDELSYYVNEFPMNQLLEWKQRIGNLIGNFHHDEFINLELKTFVTFLNAIIQKNKPRMIDKSKAMKILNNLLKEESTTEFRVNIIKNYLELLYDEIRLYGHQEAIDEFRNYIIEIFEFGSRERDIYLVIQSFFLYTFISYVTTSDIDISSEINSLYEIINNYPSLNLESKFEIEKNSFLDKINLIQKNLDIKTDQQEILKNLEMGHFIKNLQSIKQSFIK